MHCIQLYINQVLSENTDNLSEQIAEGW